MIKVEALFGLVTLALWIFSLVDVIGTDEGRMRHLPKLWWLLIVLFFPFAGSVAWLVAGRPTDARPRRSAYERAVPDYPEYDRPGRVAAVDQESDDAFLRKVRERAEEQRRKHRESRNDD
ncbi:MAG: hypothetical protein JWO46_716 [Nocardioidaceae bacterium]|nr:hypothetical protein [Nocardioidaceae bacterium]